MAHPHADHRDHKHSHDRVSHILKEHPPGAMKLKDGGAFSHVNSKGEAASHDAKVAGRKAPKRYARGGKVKGHPQTNIVIVGHRPSPTGPQAGAPMLPPPATAGAPAPPMMPPPGAGMPPGGPPGMPMRARGGRIDGESTKGNIKKWSARAGANSYARGGAAKMTAGAASGEGRLEKAGKRR